MKYSTFARYFFLAIFNGFVIYLVPVTIAFESWFLLTIIIVISLLINLTYLTSRLKPLKWITPGMIFLLSFVVFPAAYSFYVSFTNWSTGHILTKQQAILEAQRQSELAQLYEPYQRLGFLSDIYRGAPTSQMTLSQVQRPDVSPAQQLLGLGIAGLSAFGGAKQAGLFG